MTEVKFVFVHYKQHVHLAFRLLYIHIEIYWLIYRPDLLLGSIFYDSSFLRIVKVFSSQIVEPSIICAFTWLFTRLLKMLLLVHTKTKFLYKLIETSLKVLKALLNFLVIPSFSARIHSLKTNDLTFLMFTFNIETSAGFTAFFYWCPLQRVFLKIIVPVANMVYNELRYDVCL